ncbi:MAG TPA: Hsp20/alpha crystallin family protein, partial [Bacteroidia bacterium]
METLKTTKKESLVPSTFSEFFDTARFFGRNWIDREFGNMLPAVNIKENGSEFCLEFAAPGFKKENFKINTENNILTIGAEMEEEKKDEAKHYTR